MKRGIFTFLLINLICLSFWQTKANPAINLRITAPKVHLNIAPGETKTGQMAIENPIEQSVKIKCYLEDWFYALTGDGSKDFYPPSTTPLSCASWISFSPAEFVLNPYGRQVVNYRVTVPRRAEGGHYAVLFFETAIGEGKDEQGLNVLMLGRLGSLFYIEAEGTVVKEATLKDIRVSAEKEGFKVTASLKNTGNVDITASGNFNLINEQGMVFARGEFNQAYTFPEDEVFLQTSWDKQIESGSYYLIITLDLGERTLVEERQVIFSREKVEVLE